MKRSDRVHDFQLINSKRSKSEDGAISARRAQDSLHLLTMQLQMEWRLSNPEEEHTVEEMFPQRSVDAGDHSPRSSVAVPEIATNLAEQPAVSPSSKSRFNLRCFMPRSPILGRKATEDSAGAGRAGGRKGEEQQMQQGSPASNSKGLSRGNLASSVSFQLSA